MTTIKNIRRDHSKGWSLILIRKLKLMSEPYYLDYAQNRKKYSL